MAEPSRNCRMLRIVRMAAAASAALGLVTLARAVLPPAPPGVQVTTDYGIEFVTVGDPGNRPTEAGELQVFPDIRIGEVTQEFRIARTEISVEQWIEFVNAYSPFYSGGIVNPQFTGLGIGWLAGQWVASDPSDWPTVMGWDYAARYCNWLHNGKATTAEAFESGAYDTSTFTYNPDGTSNYQLTHSTDARFWIPTLDEWTKAAHWDPALNSGSGGYWYYPASTNGPLVQGPPDTGGQTNAGPETGPLPVGSYPSVMSPWGLLDTSGGVREWTETAHDPFFGTRLTRGSGDSTFDPAFSDPIEFAYAFGPGATFVGLRVAAVVPAPSVISVWLAALGFTWKRTRSLR